MNYEWLFSFVVFSEHLNFTHAAEQLHISQPALHVQIKKLAEAIGRPLYRREGRSLSLTPEGMRLAAYGREARDQGKAILEELNGKEPTGPVTLASGQGAFIHLLGPAIRRFPKDRWPLRLMTMSTPQVLDAIRNAHAHLGVVAAGTPPAELDALPLRAVGQVVIVPRSHPLSRKRRLSPRDLAGESVVAAPMGSPHRTMLDQALSAEGVNANITVEATGWGTMLQFAYLGLGLTVVNDFCQAPRGMIAVPLKGVPLVTYYLVKRGGLRRHQVEALYRLIVETTRNGVISESLRCELRTKE